MVTLQERIKELEDVVTILKKESHYFRMELSNEEKREFDFQTKQKWRVDKKKRLDELEKNRKG